MWCERLSECGHAAAAAACGVAPCICVAGRPYSAPCAWLSTGIALCMHGRDAGAGFSLRALATSGVAPTEPPECPETILLASRVLELVISFRHFASEAVRSLPLLVSNF